MHILFAPFGTEGDVRPLVAFAHAMAARGHRISFLASPHFDRLILPNGWPLIPLDTAESYRKDSSNPWAWHPVTSVFVVLGIMQRALAHAWKMLEGMRFDLVVGNTVSIPAMMWAEHARVPRLLVHIQPMSLRSTTDVPLVAPALAWTTRLSPRAAGAWFRVLDTITRPLLIPFNVFRRRHGLGALESFETLWRSVDAIAALFPPWLAAPQPDWPPNVRQFGPLRHAAGETPTLPDAVARFLAQGDKPIVWTQGSYPVGLERFVEIARATTMRMSARGIALGLDASPHDDAVFMRAPYAAHPALLPRSRALVHHGGIGTAFEAIAAGIPQLIVPRAADQYDNARRFVRTGTASSIPPNRLDAASAADALRNLLASESVANACRQCSAQLAAADPAPALCAYAEEVARRRA